MGYCKKMVEMIDIELYFVLLIGMAIMCGLILLQMKSYAVPFWKSIPFSFILVLIGVVGSQIWFFIENGYWEGRSLYGAIVFSPLVFLPASKLLKIKYVEALDFVAPSGCLILALVKIQCLRDHCCEGMILYINEDHFYVRFPSQIVEMVTFLVISAILFYIASKPKLRGKIFLWFLVIYGFARFFLDFFRETVPSYLFGLSAGSFWSLCSFIIGVTVLIIIKVKEKKQQPT